LELQGGGTTNGYEQLARAGAAAIFNACSMGYALNSSEVISMIQQGFAGSQALALQIAAELDEYNNANCIFNNSGKQLSRTTVSKLDTGINYDMTAYPTPFSDKATIEFRMAADESYVVNLYDMK